MVNSIFARVRPFIGFILIVILFIFLSIIFLISGSLLPQSRAEHSHTASSDGVDRKTYIIIDAGHGGEDGGAVSFDGLLEKDLNLYIAKKLSAFFCLSDAVPVMTRVSDCLLYSSGQENRKKFHDINNRITFANSFENSIFVSIHQNKFPIRKYKGFQVYCSPNNAESSVLGTLMQSNIRELLQNDNNRQIKLSDGKIRVLDSLNMPAVLAECGFLSNGEEARLLGTDEYKNKISYILYASILQYISENGDINENQK